MSEIKLLLLLLLVFTALELTTAIAGLADCRNAFVSLTLSVHRTWAFCGSVRMLAIHVLVKTSGTLSCHLMLGRLCRR